MDNLSSKLTPFFNLSSHLVFFLVLFGQVTLHAQSISNRVFTEKDGLPSDKVYQVILDRNEMIWVATDQGVARFDGYDFKTFTTNDGLVSNDVYQIFEDSQGRMWLYSLAGEINMIDEDQVFSFSKESPDGLFVTRLVQEDVEGNIWCSFHRKVFRFSKDGKWEEFILNLDFDSPVHPIVRDSSLAFLTRKGIIDLDHTLHLSSHTDKLKVGQVIWIFPNGNLVWMIKNEGPYFFDPFADEIKPFYSSTILPGKPDQKGFHIVPYIDNSVLLLLTDTSIVLDSTLSLVKNWDFLSPYSPISGTIDGEGNYWVVNKSGQLNYLPKKTRFLKNYANLGRVSDIQILPDGSQLFSNLKGELFKRENGKVKPVPLLYNGSPWGLAHLKELAIGPKGVIVTAGDKGVLTLDLPPANSSLPISIQKDPSASLLSFEYGNTLKLIPGLFTLRNGIKAMLEDENGVVWMGTGHGLLRMDTNSIVTRWGNESTYFRINSIAAVGDKIWIGRNDGLYFQSRNDNGNLTPWPSFSQSVLSLIEDDQGNLLIGTDGDGLYSLDYANGQITQYPESANLIVRDIKTGQNGRIFLATQFGLRAFEGNGKNTSVLTLREEHGLLSNHLNRIEILNDSLFLGSNNGLSIIAIKDLVANECTPPSVKIEHLMIRGKEASLDSNSHLSYSENQLEFKFHCLSYLSQDRVKYDYRLLGLDSSWQSTSHREVTYSALAPGTYRFEVIAESIDGCRSSSPGSFDFEISSPWWSTGLFRFSAVVLFLGLVSGGVWQLQRRARNKLRFHQQMAGLELKAIQGQMNPHFMFNALSAIQNFMLDNDVNQANNYLVRFSSLIRKYLDGAENRFVTIDSEADTLEQYIQLSQLRLPGVFEYKIEIDEALDPEEDLVPNSLLQPLVENAILHGLRHRPEPGTLLLVFRKTEGGTILGVEDNGIGREASKEMKSAEDTRRKSHGLEIVQQRITTLCLLPNIELKMTILDLKDTSGAPTGTRIEIYQKDLP